MRVLILPAHYGFGRADAKDDMQGVFFREQALALANQGHDITVLHAYFDSAQSPYVESRTASNGMREIFVHVPRSRLPINILRRTWLLIRAYRETFSEVPPDIIHAHSYPAAFSVIPVSAVAKVPYVITEHSSHILTGLSRGWRRVAQVAYARASRVLAVSSGLALAMSDITAQPVTVIPNLVAGQFFAPASTEGAAKPGFSFLSIGYWHPNKGWDILLKAFALLLKDRPQATLTLCGAQDDHGALSREILLLDLVDSVTIVGRSTRSEVKALLDAADCHVMPSRFETFGVATIEALACGRPVIMTATAAAGEIVNAGNGLTTPVDDTTALGWAMQWMFDNTSVYNEDEIRAGCRAKYSEEAVCAQLAELYRQVIDGGRGA